MAMLSRGYKRRTTGFVVADEHATALQIGDEPFQIYQQFKGKGVEVAVSEDRVVAVSLLAMDIENLRAVVLDDAFQHRSIKPHLSILLTDYAQPYWQDNVLPHGYLREPIEGAARADIIIVSKCPDKLLSPARRQAMLAEINPLPHQKVLFSFLEYEQPYSCFEASKKISLHKNKNVFLFCGIANPAEMEAYVKKNANNVATLFFPDHYNYKNKDILHIVNLFKAFAQKNKHDGGDNTIMLTTEKDVARLWAYKDFADLGNLPLYALPVKVGFEANDEQELQAALQNCLSEVSAMQDNLH